MSYLVCVTFAALLELVLANLRLRRDNGEWTERELARLAGLSQPHVHHVLAGVRVLTPAVADRLLAALELELGHVPRDGARERVLVDGLADFGLIELRR